MGTTDKIALFFCSIIVSLALTAELRDIQFCLLAITHGGGQIGQRWTRAVLVLAAIRRWAFLPRVLSCIPGLVLQEGGDALSVCFNTVSCLFLMEIGAAFLRRQK